MSADAPALTGWRAWLTGRGGIATAGVWGFAEGTLFFIMPDLILTLTALFSFRAAVRQTCAVVLGALVAGTIMFTWAAQAPGRAHAAVLAVPFVRPAMAEKVRADYVAHGAIAPMLGPTSGIPYKLYAIEAPGRVGLGPFLLVTVPARLERLLLTLALFAVAGWIFRRGIARQPAWAVAGHVVYWSVIYAIYWTVI
jgi:hypothetical protein